MKIYNPNGSLILDLDVDDNSYRNRRIMEIDSVTLRYSLAEHVELPVGAYIIFENVRYTLMLPENFKKKHSRNYDYTVLFHSDTARANQWKFRNTVDGSLKFSLTAKPREHLQMLVDNLNRRETGWSVGDCIEGTEVVITYNHAFCLDALKQMASATETEFCFEGKRVSLRKIEYYKSNPLPLSYGKGNGFKSGVGRSTQGDRPPVEIVFAEGGTENLDPSKYGNRELLLPKSQTIGFDGEHFSDEAGYNAAQGRIYVSDADGLSVRRNDKALSSHSEDSVDCTSICPKRVGTVSSVVMVDSENNLYDIVDNTIPHNLNFGDCLIEGETMTVIFQSGMLAGDGKEFEVKYYHEARNDKDGKGTKAARRFEIVPQEIDGVTMPNETFKPVAGDTYAVFHCMLPDAYICDNASKSGASWDMFRKVVRWLFDNEESKFAFTGTLDGIWAKKDWTNIGGRIRLGGYVLFSDKDFQPDGVLVRIIGVKDYINNPHSPELDLSNSTVSAGFSNTLRELKSEEVVTEEKYKQSVSFTKRRFRDAQETIGMLEKAMLENFTQSISPITVQTMSLLVGDESLQFRFIASLNSNTTVADSVVYNQADKQLTIGRSYIQHMTLGISNISSSHKPSEYKRWSVAPYTSAILTNGSAKYYLYAKVSKTDQTGTFLLSETAIKLEGVTGYYHLLVGILNSEYDGERSFASLYGFTEVLPGRITTDKIVSGNGLSFFDMLNNSMKLGDKLRYNIDGDGLLKFFGVLVQSQSGVESPLGCYRGVYNASSTYYKGDEVIYAIGGLYSLYRHINNASCHNIPPTDTAYWEPQASAGNNGDYFEVRYATNGSTTVSPFLTNEMKAQRNPSGWTVNQPSVGAQEYLWRITAKISGETDKLLSNWSNPVRITPYDGKDGEDGKDGKSPVMVYRGVYNASKTYYGNNNRLDAVKYGDAWYIARIDAPDGTTGFSGHVPTDTNYWNSFGASFESIATNLLLAEGANIGDWFIQGGRIVSTLGDDNKITLDAVNRKIQIKSSNSQGSYVMEGENSATNIDIDAYRGIIEARSADGYSKVAYMSPTGIFANRAGTEAMSATAGRTFRAAMVALGFANVNKSEWSLDKLSTLVMGVYGRASNSGTAMAVGGFFDKLYAHGLILHRRGVSGEKQTVYLGYNDTMVVGYTSDAATVYLPADPYEGQVIFVKQWWTGYMRFKPRTGHHIYDDATENEYYDFGEGQGGMFVFSIGYVTSGSTTTKKESWLVSRWEF